MQRAVYKKDGPNEKLRRKGALIRQDPDVPDNWLAQFDPAYLREAYGWWTFPKAHFIVIEDEA